MSGFPGDTPTPQAPPLPPTISAADLVTREFPPISYVVPRFVVKPSFTLLAGKPKSGKSWLALGWAFAVAAGGYVMGSLPVDEPGEAIYLGLEDNQRRLKSRLNQIGMGGPVPRGLILATDFPTLDRGAVDNLNRLLDRHSAARLVVVDVLGKLRPARSPTNSVYGDDNALVAPLKKVADERGIAVLALHHVSKRLDVADPFDAVSGSTGLTGACDSVLILARDGQGLRIYGRGRDLPEIDVAVSFDGTTGLFTQLGEASDVRRSDERKRILDVIDRAAGAAMSGTDIAVESGLTHASVRRLLSQMARNGELIRSGRGHYVRPMNGKANNWASRWEGENGH